MLGEALASCHARQWRRRAPLSRAAAVTKKKLQPSDHD
jgi:hypothetical protein